MRKIINIVKDLIKRDKKQSGIMYIMYVVYIVFPWALI